MPKQNPWVYMVLSKMLQFFDFVDCLWSLGKEEKVEGVFLIPGDIVDDIGFM